MQSVLLARCAYPGGVLRVCLALGHRAPRMSGVLLACTFMRRAPRTPLSLLKKIPTHTANDDECIALVQRWSSVLDERVTNDDAHLANDNAKIVNFHCAGRV